MEIKPGDVVVLKSGSPEMTVEYTEGDKVGCLWFINGNVVKYVFKATVLELTSTPRVVLANL